MNHAKIGFLCLIYSYGLAAEKVIFKVCSVVYPTAKAAPTAALDNTPGLKLMLGELSETLIVAGEKISQSALGKKAIQLTEKAAHVEAKLKAFLREEKNKIHEPERWWERVSAQPTQYWLLLFVSILCKNYSLCLINCIKQYLRLLHGNSMRIGTFPISSNHN
jgi:hypothetical protein